MSEGISPPVVDPVRRPDKYDAWVSERVKNPLERKARGIIKRALNADDKRSSENKVLKDEAVKRRTEGYRRALAERLDQYGGRLDTIQRDTETGRTIVVVAEKVGDVIVVAERTQEGDSIAETRLASDGSTKLTLNYEEAKYVDRGANPNIQGSDKHPEAASVVFQFLSAQMLDKYPELTTEEAKVEARTSINEKRIRNGEDELSSSFVASVEDTLHTDPESLGNFGHIYSVAQDAKERLANDSNDSATARELLAAIQKIDKHFVPEIENLSQLPEKLTQKFDALAKDVAVSMLGDYPEALARYQLANQSLQGELAGAHLNRLNPSEIRKKALQLESQRTKLVHTVDRATERAGFTTLAYNARVQFGSKSVTEQVDLRNYASDEARNAAKSRLKIEFQKAGYKNGEFLEQLPQDSFDRLSELDLQIGAKMRTLRETVNADPSQLITISREIRSLRIQRGSEIFSTKVLLAEERVKKADETWKQARVNFGEALGQDGQVRKPLRQMVEAGLDKLKALGSARYEKIKAGIAPVLNTVGESFVLTADVAKDMYQVIDSTIIDDLRELVRSADETCKDLIEHTNNTIARISLDAERFDIQTNRWYNETRNAIEIKKLAKKQEAWAVYHRQIQIGKFALADKIGGQEVKERNVERRRQKLEQMQMSLNEQIERLQNRQNPYMEIFKKDLEKRAVFLKKTVASVSSPPTPGNPDATPPAAGPVDPNYWNTAHQPGSPVVNTPTSATEANQATSPAENQTSETSAPDPNERLDVKINRLNQVKSEINRKIDNDPDYLNTRANNDDNFRNLLVDYSRALLDTRNGLEREIKLNQEALEKGGTSISDINGIFKEMQMIYNDMDSHVGSNGKISYTNSEIHERLESYGRLLDINIGRVVRQLAGRN